MINGSQEMVKPLFEKFISDLLMGNDLDAKEYSRPRVFTLSIKADMRS